MEEPVQQDPAPAAAAADKKPPKQKKKKHLLLRGALSLLFSAATLFSATVLPNHAALPNDANPETAPAPESITVDGWEQVEMNSWLDHLYVNPSTRSWDRILEEQENMSPEDAAIFNEYAERFTRLNNLPLETQLRVVQNLVNRKIDYQADETSLSFAGFNRDTGMTDIWYSPATTLQRGEGDCEDFVLLKYFLLREMGVDTDRMFIALVGNDDGARTVPNHYVLLVNIADEGTDFRVLDSKSSREDNRGNIPIVTPEESRYSFFDLRNEHGYWQRNWVLAPPTGAAALSVAGTLAIMLGPDLLKKKKKDKEEVSAKTKPKPAGPGAGKA